MVSDNLTVRPQPAPAHTGVPAATGQAGKLWGTVRADHTLRPAVGRVALVAGDTGAHTDSVDLSVLTVGTAGVRVTGVGGLDRRGRRRKVPISWLQTVPCWSYCHSQEVLLRSVALEGQVGREGKGALNPGAGKCC